MRRAQSAVETMLLMPLMGAVFVCMYYLWSICWASENSHLFAREAVLHGDTYLSQNKRSSAATPSSGLFSGNNYEKAESTSFSFSATADDESIPGPNSSGDSISVTAYIKSN